MAKIDYEGPRPYIHGIPLFNERGKITQRVTSGLENALAGYTTAAKLQARFTDNNIENYRIERVLIAGSGADRNRVDSDLDLLFLTPHLDEGSANNLKVALALMFFTERPKAEAIDVYIRKQDAYPERASKDITDQVAKLLRQYNNHLR